MRAKARLAVFGLGRLGAPLAACFAAKGYCVVGVDIDPGRVEAVNRGRAPFAEPGLQELLRAARGRLTATPDAAAAVGASEASFIVVPTPSDADGGFSLRHVLATCEAIGGALRRARGRHLVVLSSTVIPGSTGGAVRERLEQASGLRCSDGFGLCYSPEFVALGSVVRDFLRPDFVLIGESDSRAGQRLAGIYRGVCGRTVPVARMNLINAELAKLAVNTFITTKITSANTLARICERLPEADVDVVTAALGLDSRIGRKYLTGAVSYGGPCFPRDNRALAALARRLGVPAALAEATDQANRQDLERLAALVRSKLPPGGTVGILGLSYKPQTDIVDESPGLWLARSLSQAGVPVLAYDPQAAAGARQALNGTPVQLAASARACAREADVLVLATPWEAFRRLTVTGPRIVIDGWRLLAGRTLGPSVTYVPLGLGPSAARAGTRRQPQQRRRAYQAANR